MKAKLLFLLSSLAITSGYSQTVASEDFNSGLPSSWSQTTLASDGGWKNGTASALSSQNFPFSSTNSTRFMGTNDDGCGQVCNKSADRLISPSYDLTAQGNCILSVDIHFARATYQGSTEAGTIEISTNGGSSWTLLKTLSGALGWRGEMIDLSSYSTYSDVKISFLYNDGGGWMFGFGVDNFKISVPQPNNVSLTKASIEKIGLVSTNYPIKFDVKNLSLNPITSLEVSWNDGTDHTANLTTNITTGNTVSFTHTIPVNYSIAQDKDIIVTITRVNGSPDPDVTDNSKNTTITIISSSPTKKVVIEEGTGTWCMWCPRGAVAMDYMYNKYPDQFIGIAVHNDDPMTVAAYDSGANFSGFPSANVDRSLMQIEVGEEEFEDAYHQRKNLLTPFSIDATGYITGNTVSVDVNAKYFSNSTNVKYRLAAIVVEDGVTGTTNSYRQANAYAGGGYGQMGGYENLPHPVPAAQMTYNHVGRALLGGYYGQAGSIPTTLTDGQVVNYTFNYTIPSNSNRNNMSIVVLVVDTQSGAIINASSTKIGYLGVSKVDNIDFTIFPNPSTENFTVSFEAKGKDYSIEITDLQGRLIQTESFKNLQGNQEIKINSSKLTTGNYLVTIAHDGASYNKMISVK